MCETNCSYPGNYFEQTGTLTRGHPTVAAVAALEGYDERRVLQLAASVEVDTSHPIASAIVARAEAVNLPLPQTTGQLTEPGCGALAQVNGQIVAVGLLHWVQGCCNVHPEQNGSASMTVNVEELDASLRRNLVNNLEDSMIEQSQTVVFVGVEGCGVIGAIAITDSLRHDARETVQR